MKEHGILLGIDANLDQLTYRTFQKFLTSCNLIDITNHCHGPPTVTHKNGNHLELVAGSQYILGNIISARLLYGTGSASLDHSSVVIDLTTTIFDENQDSVSFATRGFTSRKKEKFLQFGTTVDQQLCANLLMNILPALLEDTTLDVKQLLCNRIDEIITTTMRTDEHQLVTQPNIIVWFLVYKF